MASLPQLKTAVSALLRSAGAAGTLQLNSNTRERAFEAYIFGLVLRAARQAGATVELIGILSGDDPSPVVFRGGPGRIGSRSQDFAYARCTLNGTTFEVHLDVEYEGSSGAVHEIDVSLVDADHADAVRAYSGRLPSTRYLRAALECKFYDSTLGVALGRTFVGLVDDCGQLMFKALATNGTNSGLAYYLRTSRRPEPFFDLSPLTVRSAHRFVFNLEQALRKWACVT